MPISNASLTCFAKPFLVKFCKGTLKGMINKMQKKSKEATLQKTTKSAGPYYNSTLESTLAIDRTRNGLQGNFKDTVVTPSNKTRGSHSTLLPNHN